MSEISDTMTKIYPYFLILFIAWMIFLIYWYRSIIFNVGFRFIRKGAYEKAIEKFKSQIQNNPKNAASFYGMGWCYYMLGDNALSIKNFKLSIEYKFREVESYFVIAVLYSEEKKFDKAFYCIEMGENLQKKKTIFDRIATFQMNEIIGWINLKKGNIESAQKYYNLAIPKWKRYFKKKFEIEKFSPSYYRFGVFYRFKKNIKKSEELFKKAIDSSPNSIFAQKSREELNKM